MDQLTLDYLFDNWSYVLQLTRDHLELSLITIAFALALAIPIALIADRFRMLTTPILAVLGAVYTIPSLAFLAFLIPVLGIGRDNAVVVLTAYAQVFLVRNIVAGLRSVDAPTLEAAKGMGLTPWQIFRNVRFPLAMPIIVAGLRTAFITVISLATVAGWIGAGGLGRLLFDGIKLRRPPMILAGAIAITLLAIGIDLLIRYLERQTAASRAARAARAATR